VAGSIIATAIRLLPAADAFSTCSFSAISPVAAVAPLVALPTVVSPASATNVTSSAASRPASAPA
jgi:hypothetical protein